jgi:hypothetical protein
LIKILEESTYSRGYREIVVPVTSGIDSRSLLGAALAVFDVKAIRCVTVGTPPFRDWVEAERCCRRVGVRQEQIDSSTLLWDVDRLTTLARERFEATGSFVTLETLVIFGAINDRVNQLPIVSGFLGDAVSGKHLPTERGRLSHDPVEASFMTHNRSVLEGGSSAALCRLFRSFAIENAWRLERLPGATTFDLLDFGFRQSHYIRPNSDAFSVCVRPFEDPRWVSHWLSRPLADRIDQRAYVLAMRRAFSQVFGAREVQERSFTRLISPLVPRPLIARLRGAIQGRKLLGGLNRGDPRTNPSMAAVLEELLAAFDRRRLLPFPTLPALAKTTRGLDLRSFQIVRWASSAELHIRAGNFSIQD